MECISFLRIREVILKCLKRDFFNNVNYDEMEHDDLHKIINPVPIYTKVLKDNCEVELDENKFYKFIS